TELAAKETRRRERFELLAFAQVEALADIDECRHRRIERTEGARDDRAEVWRGHGLRRRITGVPLVLVPRVKNETQVARSVTADQCSPIHHAADLLQT